MVGLSPTSPRSPFFELPRGGPEAAPAPAADAPYGPYVPFAAWTMEPSPLPLPYPRHTTQDDWIRRIPGEFSYVKHSLAGLAAAEQGALLAALSPVHYSCRPEYETSLLIDFFAQLPAGQRRPVAAGLATLHPSLEAQKRRLENGAGCVRMAAALAPLAPTEIDLLCSAAVDLVAAHATAYSVAALIECMRPMTQPKRLELVRETLQFVRPNGTDGDGPIGLFKLLASMPKEARCRALHALPGLPVRDAGHLHAALPAFRRQPEITELPPATVLGGFDHLPPDMVFEVFTHLPRIDLACWKQVNKAYGDLAQRALQAELRMPREAPLPRHRRFYDDPVVRHVHHHVPTLADLRKGWPYRPHLATYAAYVPAGEQAPASL